MMVTTAVLQDVGIVKLMAPLCVEVQMHQGNQTPKNDQGQLVLVKVGRKQAVLEVNCLVE